MAHIRKMTDKPRTRPWRAHINRKGHKPLVKMFAARKDAERWASEQERSIQLAGLPLTIEELKSHTVSEIVQRYLKEVTPTKGCHVSEATVLNAFLRKDIAKKSLAYVKKQDAYEYVNARLKETRNAKPISPSTVRREINSIQHVFEVAKEQWGFENLTNPFRGISIKGSMRRRNRRLREGELVRLQIAFKDCRGLNRIYVPLAVFLAIETGMRLQEIFNLTWQDIDLKKRQIIIRKSKTDYVREYAGRTIVITYNALLYIELLLLHMIEEGRLTSLSDLIFPMTKGAFKQSWADVCKRAKITDLHFHDLMREAGSRFAEAELSRPQHDLMMGHANRDMTSLYIESDLKKIQDKLDRYVLPTATQRSPLALKQTHPWARQWACRHVTAPDFGNQ
jgi:integrase